MRPLIVAWGVALAACRTPAEPPKGPATPAVVAAPAAATLPACANACRPDETLRIIYRTDDQLHFCVSGDRNRTGATDYDGIKPWDEEHLRFVESELAAGRYARYRTGDISAEFCAWGPECRPFCWNGKHAVAETNTTRVIVRAESITRQGAELSIADSTSGKEIGRARIALPTERSVALAVEECPPYRLEWRPRGDGVMAVVQRVGVPEASEVEVWPVETATVDERTRVFDTIDAGTARACSGVFTGSDPMARPFATMKATEEDIERCAREKTSRCHFLDVERDWQAYAAIPLPADVGDMSAAGAAVSRKVAARDALATRYRELATVADDERAVAANCRLAEVVLDYLNFTNIVDPPMNRPDDNPMATPSWWAGTVTGENVLQHLDRTLAFAEAKRLRSPYVRRCEAQRTRLRTWLAAPLTARWPLQAR